MSYHKIECVQIMCDNCGETYMNDHSGFSIFVDEGNAHEDADNAGWYETDDDKHYCQNCHTINDEDELIIKPKP